jgi:aspartyl-tRNA(Asn)/glutamyl-tRNA(Gln) amidotransferase subunit C
MKQLFLFIIDWKMKVDDALIENLSRLACLEFSEKEKESIRKDLEDMIGFVEKLKELDTTGMSPVLQMSTDSNVFREDDVNQELQKKDALRNAPDANDSFFRVPKVIKNPLK